MSTPNKERAPQRPRHWLWEDAWPVIRTEICIAATVAGSLTIVLLARRWATTFLGHGLLNAEIFAGSTVVNELIGQVEQRVRSRGETHDRHQRSAGRRSRAQNKRGPTNGTENGTNNA
jgi:hypothetical protein